MKATPLVWTGRVLSALFVLFMLFASIMPKFAMPEVAQAASRPVGIEDANIPLIGVLELIGTVLYIWPRTALLGGAIATHMNAGSPLPSHTFFGIYLGLIMWAGLWLRDADLRAVLPIRRAA